MNVKLLPAGQSRGGYLVHLTEWNRLLALGLEHGWQPAGAMLLHGPQPVRQPDGTPFDTGKRASYPDGYTTGGGAMRIMAEDAAALAAAWQRSADLNARLFIHLMTSGAVDLG